MRREGWSSPSGSARRTPTGRGCAGCSAAARSPRARGSGSCPAARCTPSGFASRSTSRFWTRPAVCSTSWRRSRHGASRPTSPPRQACSSCRRARLPRAGVRAGTRLDLGAEAPRRGGALGAAAGNVGLALLAAFFFAAHVAQGRASGRWLPVLPILVEEALLVGLFLVRRPSRRTSTRLGDWALAVGSTYLPLLLRATARTWALAPSLGIVAADRGVRTRGLYRGVRHPLYAGETLSYLGYLVSYPSLRNALVVLVTTLALAVRAGVEERFLAANPAYRAYCASCAGGSSRGSTEGGAAALVSGGSRR